MKELTSIIEKLTQMCEDADDLPEEPATKPERKNNICPTTGVPANYRQEWERPTDPAWLGQLDKTLRVVNRGGIAALVGGRGTGKTRLACEVVREYARDKAIYQQVMYLFVTARGSYRGEKGQSEKEIIDELCNCRLLVLDEIQERGNTDWEDRILTLILDRRYSNGRPTILIANLKPAEFSRSIGDSVTSRLVETGGMIEMNGPSHRTR